MPDHGVPLESVARSVSQDAVLVAGTVIIPCLGAALVGTVGASSRTRSLVFPSALSTSGATTLWIAWLWSALPRPFWWSIEWFSLQDAHTGLGFFVDDLSVLFALAIAGLGTLAVLYSRAFLPHYLSAGAAGAHGRAPLSRVRRETRYYAIILLFTASMLGMVFATDLVQIYVLWETADIAAFLLIGLNWQTPAARHGAIKTFLFTAFGGIAILVGIVVLGATAGTTSLPELLERGDAVQGSPLAFLALLLLVTGVAAKSAQAPLHVWLPNAMVAPTPANAYLDSATLVAAGVYLLARLHPLFAGTAVWQWSVTAVGLLSIFVGGALALKARDLKVILAYSTTSQLGFIIALLGLGSDLAYFGALFLFLHHGLLKAGLFFVAGCVTFCTGRNRLGNAAGLWRHLPVLAVSAAVLALSLGGVPLLAGFWMKELFLESLLETEHLALIALGVASGALTLTYMLRFFAGAIVQDSRDSQGGDGQGSDEFAPSSVLRPLPRTMLLPPLLLAAITLISGLFPHWTSEALVMPAAHAMLEEEPHVEFAIHLDALLVLSLLALTLGAIAFATYGHWRPLVPWLRRPAWSLDRLYGGGVAAVSSLGQTVLRLQSGDLTRYLTLIVLAVAGLIVATGAPSLAREALVPVGGIPLTDVGMLDWVMALVLVLIAIGTVLTFALQRLVQVILALSAVGLLIAAYFALAHAPNLGLVQVHVETLVTVLFVTVLVRLPRALHERGERSVQERVTPGNVTLAAAGGAGAAWISWHAIEASPIAPVAPWFNEHTEETTHASDVVAAILVHFRALDTLGEIVVFGTATLGVLAILQLKRGKPE